MGWGKAPRLMRYDVGSHAAFLSMLMLIAEQTLDHNRLKETVIRDSSLASFIRAIYELLRAKVLPLRG